MRSWDAEYPRPMLRRESFLAVSEGWTLNGRPIRVPFPPEAELSGFRGESGEELDYRVTLRLPEGFCPPGHRVILHLGAVDQTAEVFVNGTSAVRHQGGYLPFSADITDLLRGRDNELRVLAVDRLSTDYPYGKQCKKPHGMWYTPVSGIWQTVWLEAVPAAGAVRGLRVTPDLTGVTLEVDTDAERFTVTVPEAGLQITSHEKTLRIDIPSPHLWTPEDPHLYDFTVATESETVSSYFALRTVTLQKIGGHTRVCLNGRPVYLHGVLDQGYFRDGLFLPREPEEYERDIRRIKELGFNTLRKHIKIEPEAFYCACDRLGMLVLQDMVNSGVYHFLRDTALPTAGFRHLGDARRRNTPKRRAFFEQHVRDTLDRLYSHPCVIGYTIFNEGWGQYDSDRIYGDCKTADPTRVFISTSGWFAQKRSDAESRHIYFRTEVLDPPPPGRFLMLSEFGGISRRVEGHVRQEGRNYGYGKQQDTEEALTAQIEIQYRDMVLPSIKNGLCGSIYTQLSDVESETNGLYTYDRQVRKVDKAAILKIAEQIKAAFAEQIR